MSIPAFLFQSRSEEKNTDRCVALDNASGPYTAEEARESLGGFKSEAQQVDDDASQSQRRLA
jgi:hypothetical protein